MGYIEILAPEGSRKPWFSSVLQKRVPVFSTPDQVHEKLLYSRRKAFYPLHRRLVRWVSRSSRAEEIRWLETCLKDRKIMRLWESKESWLEFRDALFSETPGTPGPSLWKYEEIFEKAIMHQVLADHSNEPIIWPRGVLHAVATTATHCRHSKTWVSRVVSTLPFQVHGIVRLSVDSPIEKVSRDFTRSRVVAMDYIKNELYANASDYLGRLVINQNVVVDHLVKNGAHMFHIGWDSEMGRINETNGVDSLRNLSEFLHSQISEVH